MGGTSRMRMPRRDVTRAHRVADSAFRGSGCVPSCSVAGKRKAGSGDGTSRPPARKTAPRPRRARPRRPPNGKPAAHDAEQERQAQEGPHPWRQDPPGRCSTCWWSAWSACSSWPAASSTSTRRPSSRTRTRTSRPRRRSSTTTTARHELGQLRDPEPRRDLATTRCRRTCKDAVVAAENRSFWTDNGIDPKGIVRAVFNNASGNATQGASTITQQYVKILYLTQERSYTRKVKEAILSLKLGATAVQAGDPRGLPQHHLLRPRRLRHPGGGAGVLRQGRRRAEPPGERRAGQHHQQPDPVRPGQRQGREAGAPGALRLRARRHGRGRRHHRRRGRAGRRGSCRSSRSSRRTTSTAARRATCSRW